ncbi:hypothetical protein PG989_007892 [Apiospora arundinis]
MGPSPPIPPSASPPLSANGRQRNSSTSSNGQNAGKYRKIAAAPMAHSRPWVQNGGSELRLSNYDPKGSIKDYTANEPPPSQWPNNDPGLVCEQRFQEPKPGHEEGRLSRRHRVSKIRGHHCSPIHLSHPSIAVRSDAP